MKLSPPSYFVVKQPFKSVITAETILSQSRRAKMAKKESDAASIAPGKPHEALMSLPSVALSCSWVKPKSGFAINNLLHHSVINNGAAVLVGENQGISANIVDQARNATGIFKNQFLGII